MSLDVEFECEKKFEDLKFKSHLRYDFFLPEYGLVIEYHGEQHYERQTGHNGRWSLEEIQERDRLKEQYAKAKGLWLLVVSSEKQGRSKVWLKHDS